MEELQNRDKCYKCYRPISSCSCVNIKNKIDTKTRFIILMHPKEFRKTKNGTGFMTKNSLNNCQVHLGIDFTNNEKVNELLSDDNYSSYLLYPGNDAININKEKISVRKNLQIFLIDSTWPCSKKILRLSKNLQKLPLLSFETLKTSAFKIKTQPNKYCLSTIECTGFILEQLSEQKIENISEDKLNNFLEPFFKMVNYQNEFTLNKNIRYKKPFKKI